MKKIILIIFLSALGLTGLHAQTVNEQAAVEQSSQDRIKISTDDIPQPVKRSISQKAELQDLRITEAYEINKGDGLLHYEVYFDNGGEVMSRKYDAAGKEVKEEDF